MIEGVDYSFSPPGVTSLVANGKKFAIRYGGPGTSDKWLTAFEYAALTAAGIEVVANAEGSASGFQGWNAGVSWATSAWNYFRGLGMPANRPIYFSADWDVTATQWPTVRAALQGAASVIGSANVGLYAGRWPIEWARRDGVAAWFWQTYAWSGGYWVPGNHLEQYRNGVPMGNGDVDLDRALTADYGQWGYTSPPSDPKWRKDMFAFKTANDPKVYVSDGVRYRGVADMTSLNALIGSGALAKPTGTPVDGTGYVLIIPDGYIDKIGGLLDSAIPVDVNALAAAIVAALPPVVTLTSADVEAAVRTAHAHGLAP